LFLYIVHIFFRPKNPPVSKIVCHALEGSPVKPTVLDIWNKEDKKHIPSEPVIVGTINVSKMQLFSLLQIAQ